MNKHAPEPWAIGLESDDNTGQVIAVDGSHICYVEHYPLSPTTHLIVAAPKLLAACLDLIDQIEGIGIEDWHGAEGLDLSSARSAVAEAKGEITK